MFFFYVIRVFHFSLILKVLQNDFLTLNCDTSSGTTRAARPGEVNGVDYTFLSIEEFQAKEKAGELLESGIFDGKGNFFLLVLFVCFFRSKFFFLQNYLKKVLGA